MVGAAFMSAPLRMMYYFVRLYLYKSIFRKSRRFATKIKDFKKSRLENSEIDVCEVDFK